MFQAGKFPRPLARGQLGRHIDRIESPKGKAAASILNDE
jgi:hypothetical protein